MTAAVAIKKNQMQEHGVTHLIPVIYKKNRLYDTYKVRGAVLDSNAVHGRGFVVRRVAGQDQVAVMSTLKAIIEQRERIDVLPV